jgi:uncharacterized membrane protein
MQRVLFLVLIVGVTVSSFTIAFGAALLLYQSPGVDFSSYYQYPPRIEGSIYSVNPSRIFAEALSLQPIALIELGVLILLAVPVIRVGLSILLFAFERDILYSILTLVVLIILLFGILVAPSIPSLNAG